MSQQHGKENKINRWLNPKNLLALTDNESDNATAPRRPDHMRMVASFQSKP
jgi:hypothetical protein